MTKNNKINQVFLSKLSAFVSNATGQISMMFALLLIPLAAFIGGALDFTQQVSYSNKLQATLDSVSVAVAKEIARDSSASKATLQAIADAIYNANITHPTNVTTSAFTITQTDEILTITQVGDLKTSFMGLVGTPTLPINVSSLVNIKRSDVELALILDMSGSMGGTKIADLKAATKDLVNTLIKDTTGLASIKISYVPWTRGVYIKAPLNKTALKNNSSGWYTCSGSRKTASEKSPSTAKLPISKNSSGYQEYCPKTTIVPLTDDKSKLLAEVDLWSAGGGTYSDTGLTWGWGTLSPLWNGLWSESSKAKPYKSAKKFAVLMSDGDNNTSKADTRSKKLCKLMKKKGIQIYTIAFKAGAKAKKLLKKCASTKDKYIDASSGAALKAAFEKIADEVGSFYISG